MHGEFVGPACGHHGPYTPDVLFWSSILFFTTFALSSTLKTFKTSRYFPTKASNLKKLFIGNILFCPLAPVHTGATWNLTCDTQYCHSHRTFSWKWARQ